MGVKIDVRSGVLNMNACDYFHERDTAAFQALMCRALNLSVMEFRASWHEPKEDADVVELVTKPDVDQYVPKRLRRMVDFDLEFVDQLTYRRSGTRGPRYEINVTSLIPFLKDSQYSISTRLTIEPLGPGRCVQRLEGEVDIRVFGIGSVVQGIVLNSIQNAYRVLPEVVERWVALREEMRSSPDGLSLHKGRPSLLALPAPAVTVLQQPYSDMMLQGPLAPQAAEAEHGEWGGDEGGEEGVPTAAATAATSPATATSPGAANTGIKLQGLEQGGEEEEEQGGGRLQWRCAGGGVHPPLMPQRSSPSSVTPGGKGVGGGRPRALHPSVTRTATSTYFDAGEDMFEVDDMPVVDEVTRDAVLADRRALWEQRQREPCPSALVSEPPRECADGAAATAGGGVASGRGNAGAGLGSGFRALGLNPSGVATAGGGGVMAGGGGGGGGGGGVVELLLNNVPGAIATEGGRRVSAACDAAAAAVAARSRRALGTNKEEDVPPHEREDKAASSCVVAGLFGDEWNREQRDWCRILREAGAAKARVPNLAARIIQLLDGLAKMGALRIKQAAKGHHHHHHHHHHYQSVASASLPSAPSSPASSASSASLPPSTPDTSGCSPGHRTHRRGHSLPGLHFPPWAWSSPPMGAAAEGGGPHAEAPPSPSSLAARAGHQLSKAGASLARAPVKAASVAARAVKHSLSSAGSSRSSGSWSARPGGDDAAALGSSVGGGGFIRAGEK